MPDRETQTTRLSNEEWEALNHQLFTQTKTQFFDSLEQFHLMNWPVARLIHWTLGFFETKLDDDLIGEIRKMELEDVEEKGHDEELCPDCQEGEYK